MSEPADAVEPRVLSALETLGVPYEILRIDPAYADTAAFCERYEVPLVHSANTIVVASKKAPRQWAACVVQATRRLDVNHAVRRLMNVSKLSFASAEETQALTGMMLGGVTVLALPPELPVYVDDKLTALEWVILGGGSRSWKVKTSPEIFRRLPGATIVSDLGVDA